MRSDQMPGFRHHNRVLRYHTSAQLCGTDICIQTANFAEATKYLATYGIEPGSPLGPSQERRNVEMLKDYKVSSGETDGRGNYKVTWTDCTGRFTWLLQSTEVRKGDYQFVVLDIAKDSIKYLITQEEVVSYIRSSQATLSKHLKAFPRKPINGYLVQYYTFAVPWIQMHDTRPPKGKRRKNFAIKDKLDQLIVDIDKGLPISDVKTRLQSIVDS